MPQNPFGKIRKFCNVKTIKSQYLDDLESVKNGYPTANLVELECIRDTDYMVSVVRNANIENFRWEKDKTLLESIKEQGIEYDDIIEDERELESALRLLTNYNIFLDLEL